MRIGQRRLLQQRKERWQKPYNALHPAVLEIQESEAGDNRRAVRLGLIACLVVHVLVFVMVWPSSTEPLRQVGRSTKVYKLRQVKFQPPRARPQAQRRVTKPKTKKIPIPDPTPDEPEPIEREDFVTPPVDFPDVEVGSMVSIPDGPPGPSTAVFEISGNVKAPVRIFAPDPVYTEDARHTRVQGVVILQTIIDALGNVTNIRVLKGLPSGLTESAVEAVERWRFNPATLEGQPVPVHYMVTISFSVQ